MNLLSINDLSLSDINSIYKIAGQLKSGKIKKLKKSLILALLFEKPSTRTRVSFESAIMRLGGNSIYIDAKTTQLSRGEPLKDTARILGMYVDMVAARLFKQEDLLEIAKYSAVPVINALTDLEHPTQSLADLYTIKENKKNAKGLKIAFVGDIAANTANSLMLCATKLGASVILIAPKEWPANKQYLNKARVHGNVEITSSMEDGLSDADVIYTDTFVSMGDENNAAYREKALMPYQLNGKTMKHAKKGSVVMHCLPAHRGEEITDEVLEGPQSIVWKQAENKMLIEQAIIVYLSRSNSSQ